MDKLTISKEEEKLIGEYREVVPEAHRWIEQFRKYQKDPFKSAQFMPLLDFTPQQFALLLCGWYEVEQPFEVGEWMYNKSSESVYQMDQEDFDYLKKAYANEPINHLRKATSNEIAQEKERRRWEKIGRVPGKYKIGDIFKNGDMLHEVESLSDPAFVYEGFESFRKDKITLVTPVEQRFDKEDT